MCGIVGYIGNGEAFPILIKGLKWLEYRGYDSSGIAILNGSLNVYKKAGKVAEMEKYALAQNYRGSVGIGHTRWATHGEPNDVNAHPHVSANGLFSVVHNGIIENYAELKKGLTEQDYTFCSDTDTEVLTNLIEYFYRKSPEMDAETAVQLALSRVVGAYGVAVLCSAESNKMIVARKGSPLVVGLGNQEYFVASDAAPLTEFTEQVVYLNNEDIGVLTKDSFTLKNV